MNFIHGGGEMGILIREKDWSNTPLGHPDTWPQELRTMVSIMVENPFGMYIAWGEDFIQLYNDAYRPILGTDKHPSALGIRTRETFAEIWPTIGPMFEGVMQGIPVGFPDFILHLNRNGYTEECYFDFSYSPIRKDDGAVGGVLVTVTETTTNKITAKTIKNNEERFRQILNGLPIVVWTAAPDGGLTYISDQWESFYGNPLNVSLGAGWTNFVHPDDLEKAGNTWAHSLQTGENYETEFRVTHKDGTYHWILVRALPVRNERGEIIFWNGSNTDIQDKKSNEEALKQSEEKFRAMSDNIPNLAWMADAEGYIYWYNKKWYDFTGTTPQEMEGWGWQSVHDADQLPKVLEEWKRSIETGNPFEMVFPIKGADGNFRQFLTRVLPVRNEEGQITQWFGSNTDITPQLQTEQSLKESEARFKIMAEGTDVLIATTDEFNKPVYFNNAWVELTGKSPAELQAFDWAQLIHEKDFEKFSSLYMDAFAKQDGWIGELRIRNKYGKYRWVLTKGGVLYKADGSFGGYMSSGVDITERKNAEKITKESEENLRNTILQSPIAMCIFKGPDYVVELANERMYELWGRSEKDILNKPIFEGLPEAKAQGFEALLEGVYTTGQTFSAQDVPIQLPRNGKMETVYVNFVYEAYRETNGLITGILAVAVDVTLQVLARQKIEDVVAERTKELADANHNLQKSNAELAQFAYIASHDLQEPLRKISTFAQMLESNIGNTLDEKSKTFLTKINNSSVRMTTLIRDVLTYSELVKENEMFSPVNLNEVVENIKTDYELLIEQKQATIIAVNLPVIDAIPLQMSQLFGNLIGNALKFVRHDVKPVIKITAALLDSQQLKKYSLVKGREFYLLQFSDNGIGFKKEYAEQIFNIFQRLHGKTEYEGTGIGLAMCKKIALNHNGELNAEGSSENGAVFNVILPAKQFVKGF